MSKQAYRAGIVSVLLVATRVVAADITNQPPQVKIFSPPNGAVFAESSDILVLAAARDPDGVVQTVEFFADAKSLGVVTNPPMMLDTSQIPNQKRPIYRELRDSDERARMSKPAESVITTP